MTKNVKLPWGGGKTLSYLLASGGSRFVASALLALFAFAATQTVQAADCYWAGGTSSDWATSANWTTTAQKPTNDGAYFRSDKFHNNFKSGSRAYLVTFSAAETNNWRTYFNNCGSASAPIVLRGTSAANGLTSGDYDTKRTDGKQDTYNEGIYIGTNLTGGNGGTTDSKASTGNAYVRFEQGTFATRNTYSYFFLGNNSYDGNMTVAGATINASSDFKIFSGSLTIESGTVNVTSWTRFENTSRAKAINLDGGTLHTYRINKQGGTGAATVNFNGGTLRIKTDYNSVIDSGITVNVKANGGTIDVNGTTTAAIPASFSEDSSSPGGGMKFCGGGTLTLGGTIGWKGGTTIEAGTTLKVSSAAQKDALLGSGVNTLKVIPPTTAGEYALITITGSDEFTESDLLKVAVVPGSAGAATFSISNDRKSLMLSAAYTGGEINQSTPTLVFPGATLADLATHTLRARMQGDNFDADGVEATFFNRQETMDGDTLANVTYQLQAVDETSSHHYTKAAKVEFTADANGVYAKLVEGNYTNYGNPAQFGNDPLTNNPGTSSYIPYDFRLVEPANAISVNINPSGRNNADNPIDTTSSVRYGAGDYAVPYSSWSNFTLASNGNAQNATIGGATVTVQNQQGNYFCSNLAKTKDVRYGYIDDSADKPNPQITVENIPYEFYRIVVYMSSDTANCRFGYLTMNGKNYTASGDARSSDTVDTVEGTATWGYANAGAGNYLYGLKEGVNYLVSDVNVGSTAMIVGHRSSTTVRTGIAAFQIVEYVPTTYTATISDGGAKTFSALSWDNALPSLLTANDRVVVNVNEDTTLNIDIPVDVYGITFNVADGKTLTLSGNNIAAQYITATGAGQTVVASASQLAGTVKGDGTLVYDAVPSGITLTESVWSGVLWLKNGTMNGLLAQNLASANSTLRLTGVTGYFNNGDSEMTCLGTLELVDDGATPAFTVSNGFSTNGKTVFAAVKGDGTFKSDTTTAQRYVFKDVSAFTGTINIPSGKNTRVILGNGTSLNPANGTITVASGATATVAAGKTWTAQGGMVVDGTLMLGAGATAPAVVSGTGTVGVTSGTGTLNGYGANAALELATAPGATLAIVDNTLTSMTIGAFNNVGTIDLTGTALTEATLNLGSGVTAATTGTILYPATFKKFVVSPADQSVRSLDGYTLVTGLPQGVAYYVTVVETREEFGKGSMTVADCAAGVNVRVVRPNGTSIDVVPVDGTATLAEAAQIAGAATAFDFTYTNTAEKAYSAPAYNIGWDADTKPVTFFNNTAADKTTGAYIKHHPWVTGAGNLIALENFTIVLVGTMSPSHNTQFFHMGSTTGSNKGILITTTANDNEVMIAKNTGATVDAANGVKASVPNAATARHAYVIKKLDTVVEVWVDGVKRGQFDGGEGFSLPTGGGIQVGSDHGGQIKEAGTYAAVANTDSETGYLNVLRMFDYVLSDAQIEKVFSEYPYVSQGGLYTREVSADGAFSQTDAWQKEGEAGAFTVPAGATVDDIFYNPSVTLTANAAAELEVNATVAIENLTVGGSSALTFASDGEHTVSVLGAAIINSPVTNEYGAVYLAGAPVQLGSAGSICFDLRGMDTSTFYTESYVQLTGLMDRDDAKVTAILPVDPDRSFAISYNTSGSCYVMNVTPLRNYIVVENRVTASPALTAETANIAVGSGGLDIGTLSIPADATFGFDPIKTPVYVYGSDAGSFAVGEGAKVRLSSAYSGMTLGRVVLFTYIEAAASLPENLNDIFDATTIASGAMWAVTSEDAPDASGGRKQLVLTVGDYANNAKEIRILPVGDSITQGVAVGDGDTQDRFAQYRSTIAARLAANGYKPKMLGVWKRANYNASHTMIPEDWAWHCGISDERLIAGGNRGGIRENMHVYLDIAGDVNAITLLAGTNDLDNGMEAADLYVEYTNLVAWTAAQRPTAKIIGAAILDRSNSEAREKVAQFNALLRTDFQAGELPANFVLLDLDEAVPLEGTGNFYDGLNLTWKGCVAAGESFAGAIMDALPLTGEGAISGAADASVTDEPQTALGAAAIDDLAAYRADMKRVYAIDGAATNCFTSVPYTAIDDNSASTRPVAKAGYFMELVRKGTNRRRWVWVDFDATGKTLGEIDFPWEGANMDFIAEKLHVRSNDPSIHSVAANDDTASGVVEGTKWNYSSPADNENVPADVSDGYGWNDKLGSSGGYGGFQVHRILSTTEAEVLFAWNCWGSEKQNQVDEIGIGTFAKSTTLGGSFSMDYTFVGDTTDGTKDTLSSDAYSVRRLEIWVKFAGEPRANCWSGAAGDGDFDNTGNWENGVVPSAGADIDFSAGGTVAVMGASSGKTFVTATTGANVVTFTGSIAFTAITDTSKIAVGANSTVTLDGDLMFTDASGDKHIVYKVDDGGAFIVTGTLGKASGAGCNLFPQASVGGGVVVANQIADNGSSSSIHACVNLTSQKWVVGPGGITTSSGRSWWCLSDTKNSAYFYPNTSDFTIAASTTIRSNFGHYELNTTGWGDDKPHTITLAAPYLSSSGDGNGKLYIAGTGKVVVDTASATYDGAVDVSGSATLAIGAGKKLTSGEITVNDDAALEVATSGKWAPSGSLALNDGATLKFNFTNRSTPPVLNLEGKTVTFGDQKLIKVSLTGVHPAYGADGKYILTDGGKFKWNGENEEVVMVKVEKGDGCAKWVKEVGVDADGNLYANIKPAGTIFFFR